MASIVQRLVDLEYQVYQLPGDEPEPGPEHRNPKPGSVEVEVTISLELKTVRHDCLTDEYVEVDADPRYLKETRYFNLRHFRNQYRAHWGLSLMLSRMGIDPNDIRNVFNGCIAEIIGYGARMARAANEGYYCRVLPLRANMWATLLEEVNFNYEDIDTTTLEARNYGMVPAKESAVKEMLKRVRVEVVDEESEIEKGGERSNIRRKRAKVEDKCAICLDEFKVGSEASEMPCLHTFHGDCIGEWLTKSHYCPLCRFEMPISDTLDSTTNT